jgi:CDP-diacylglycerol--glycerol-3-phosphate 3-phosphatidyltransferase
MNLPNRLTLLRIALVPVYLVALAIRTQTSLWLALIVFIAAALTDVLDGRIARARGQVTAFGKFMDPIADKLLIIPALMLMVEQGLAPAWVGIVFVAREFIISGVRLVAAERGVTIAAGIWGKAKTVLQIVAIGLLTVNLDALRWLATLCLYGATALALISCAIYLWQTRDLLWEAGRKG